MIKDYQEVLNIIKKSYNSKKFDSKMFEFYKTRKEKNKYALGMIHYKNNVYYFKMVKKEDFIEREDLIEKMVMPNFSIVKKYGDLDNGDEIINLYEYVPAPRINAFNYLRNSKYSYEDKKKKLEKFFDDKMELMRQNYKVERMDGSKKSDRWFSGRLRNDAKRMSNFGKNFELLYKDICSIYPNGYINIKNFLDNIETYLNKQNLIVTTYSHGDFHDFNFSLDKIFWDIDTFDYNPLLNDFTIYYWHFLAREDYLIYKYCPWLTPYMYNELDEEELKKIRELKKQIIYNWYDEIERIYAKYNIKNNIYSEFLFKLFCRVFLVNNVMEYDIDDRIKTYKIFDYFLSNENKNLKDLLFSSEIIFESIKK